ncbi:MAG TPA: hypothetical protein VFF14_11465 [Candidatus Deferrimicrobium sp.]|nr:hypothetical protein [Candidatus Deferrimicrobium sp.]
MRKIVLLLIITMSLTLTSGFSAVQNTPQARLNALLKDINVTELTAEITTRVKTPKLFAETSESNYKSFSPIVAYIDRLGTHAIRKVTTADEMIVIDTYKLNGISEVFTAYMNARSTAINSGGDAYLAIKCRVPKRYEAGKELGNLVLKKLGGDKILQPSLEANQHYSAVTYIPEWGKAEKVENDLYNLEVIVQPNFSDDSTSLYLLAPVFIGDLGEL